jgi:two-component sensor histidine kinase
MTNLAIRSTEPISGPPPQLILAEANHRVKNYMQILYGLLSIARHTSRDPHAREVLDTVRQRVDAMVSVQQFLCELDGGASTTTSRFLDRLCANLRASLGWTNKIRVVESSHERLPQAALLPVAMIVNELVTNAMKHGVADVAGAIRIGLRTDGRSFILYVEDNGPGFALPEVLNRFSGLGLTLEWVRQLQGTFEVKQEPYTRCIVRF